MPWNLLELFLKESKKKASFVIKFPIILVDQYLICNLNCLNRVVLAAVSIAQKFHDYAVNFRDNFVVLIEFYDLRTNIVF